MGKGKKHESAAQERKNLLGINPIPDHASGSWMSKHSIASRGSQSPLHNNDSLWDKAKQKVADTLTWEIRGGLSAGGDLQSQRRKPAYTTVGKALTGIKHTTAEKQAMAKKKKRFNVGG